MAEIFDLKVNEFMARVITKTRENLNFIRQYKKL